MSKRSEAMDAVSRLRRMRRTYGSDSDEAKSAEKTLDAANRAMRPKTKPKRKPQED